MRKCMMGDLPQGIIKADNEIKRAILKRPNERGTLTGTAYIEEGIIKIGNTKYRTGDVLIFDEGESEVYTAISTVRIENYYREGNYGHEAENTVKRSKKGK